jgi:GT2 family glycosyltransferase
VPPDWLRKLAEVLEREPDAGIVGGPDEVMYSGTRFGPALDWVLSSFVGTAGCRREGGLSAGKYYPRMCNMGIPRRVALAAALKAGDGPLRVFNESLNVHENVDLANRVEQLGKRIVYAPELCITNRRDTTFFSFLRRNFDMARAARTLGAHRLPHALVTISVLGFLALAVMAVFFQVFGVLLGVCVVMYALTLLCSALAAAKKTKRLDVLVAVPLLLLGIHLARGFGYLFPLSCREGAAGNA